MNNNFNLQDIAWAFLFSFRGLAWGYPLLCLTSLSMGGHISWFNHPGMSFLAFIAVFSCMWAEDYKNNYLPKWVSRHVTL